MNRRVLAVMVAFAFAPAAHALRVPPGGGCPPNALCEAAKQLVTIPAFFETTTQTDPSQPRDWVRIQNAGHWVKIVVAGDTFHLKAAPDLLNARAHSPSNIRAGRNLCG